VTAESWPVRPQLVFILVKFTMVFVEFPKMVHLTLGLRAGPKTRELQKTLNRHGRFGRVNTLLRGPIPSIRAGASAIRPDPAGSARAGLADRYGRRFSDSPSRAGAGRRRPVMASRRSMRHDLSGSLGRTIGDHAGVAVVFYFLQGPILWLGAPNPSARRASLKCWPTDDAGGIHSLRFCTLPLFVGTELIARVLGRSPAVAFIQSPAGPAFIRRPSTALIAPRLGPVRPRRKLH